MDIGKGKGVTGAKSKRKNNNSQTKKEKWWGSIQKGEKKERENDKSVVVTITPTPWTDGVGRRTRVVGRETRHALPVHFSAHVSLRRIYILPLLSSFSPLRLCSSNETIEKKVALLHYSDVIRSLSKQVTQCGWNGEGETEESM